MKIYTKNGDQGMTTLIGGKKIYKDDIQIDAYGTIDELISYIGLIRSLENDDKIKKILLEVQEKLMVCATIVATDKGIMLFLPIIKESDIILLEQWIDMMTEKLPILNSFILPGGTPISAHCHIARTICRRAERLVISVTMDKEIFENDIVIKYLNRLSDFLFTLARLLNVEEETLWTQKKGE